jgi:hypothetical protein
MGPTHLTLYVAGTQARTQQVLGRVRRTCEELGSERVLLEIVDVLADPLRAGVDGVHVTPTLLAGTVREGVRVFGDLTDVREALWTMGVGGSA